MAAYFTREITRTQVLEYKFDLRAVANGREGAKIDVLQPDEKIASYTLSKSDSNLVITHDAITDYGTSVLFFPSALNVTGDDFFVDCHFVTDSNPPRHYDASMRFVLVERMGMS